MTPEPKKRKLNPPPVRRSMCTNSVMCLILWGGEWKTVANTMTYVGGESKFLRFSTKIKLERLKERIYASTCVDSTSFDLRMTMQTTCGSNNVLGRVVPIVDRNDVRCFIEYCRMNPNDLIPLYVAFIPRTIDDQIPHECMKDNEHIMSSNVESNPSLDDTHEDQPIDVEVATHEDSMGTYNGDKDDDYVEEHCVHEHEVEVHSEVPLERSQPHAKGFPETNPRAIYVSSTIYETNDEQRRRTDPFRWLPKVHDTPVIPVVSNASREVMGLMVHDIFSNKKELQDALGKYAIQNKFEWKVYKSNKSLFVVKCKHDNICKWRARAIIIPNTEMFRLGRIDRIDQHTCPRDEILSRHRHAGKRVAGTILRKKFHEEDKVYRPKDIISDFEKEYKINISYMQAYRARSWALKSQVDIPEESNISLPDNSETLEGSNTGLDNLVKEHGS